MWAMLAVKCLQLKRVKCSCWRMCYLFERSPVESGFLLDGPDLSNPIQTERRPALLHFITFPCVSKPVHSTLLFIRRWVNYSTVPPNQILAAQKFSSMLESSAACGLLGVADDDEHSLTMIMFNDEF